MNSQNRYLSAIPKLRPEVVLLATLSGIIGIGAVITASGVARIGIFSLLAVAALALSAIYRLRETLLIFGLFVLMQDLIVENIGGYESVVGGLIKKVDEAVILGSILILLTGRLARGQMRILHTPIDIPLIGLVMVGILSSLTTRVPFFIASSQLFLLIKGFLVFYIFANLQLSQEDLKKFVRTFGIAAGIILLLGIVDLAMPAGFRTIIGNSTLIDWRAGVPTVQSLFIHPGVFGWFMAFAALFAFAFYFVYQKNRYLMFAFCFSLGTFFSMRRKALGGLVSGLLVGLQPLSLYRKVRYGLLITALGSSLFILAFPKIEFLYEKMEQQYFKNPEPSQVARVALYTTSIQISKDYFPLGAGLGRFGSWMSRVHYSPLYDDYDLSEVAGLSRDMPNFINDTFWPMILGETGIFGLTFYVWAMLAFLMSCYRGFLHLTDPFQRAFALGTLMVLVEGLVESLADPVFVKPPQAYFLFGVVGITYSLVRRENSQ